VLAKDPVQSTAQTHLRLSASAGAISPPDATTNPKPRFNLVPKLEQKPGGVIFEDLNEPRRDKSDLVPGGEGADRAESLAATWLSGRDTLPDVVER